MTMSKDRVHFQVNLMTNDDDLRQLINDTLGECLGRCDWGDITFVCRPSQFARFLIERNNRNMPNVFKELKPKLVKQKENKCRIMDTSENKHMESRIVYHEED